MNNEEIQREMMIEALKNKHRTNHILHLILSLITVGVWIPVWILVSISNSIERGKVERRANSDTFAHRLGRLVGNIVSKTKGKNS
jgi:hypothetical protein